MTHRIEEKSPRATCRKPVRSARPRIPRGALLLGVAFAALLVGAAGPARAQTYFSDTFDVGPLQPAWIVDSGSFAVSGGELVESTSTRFLDAQMRWNGGQTATPDQFAKLRVDTRGSRTWGFMLRVGDSTGHFYQVHLPSNSDWRWELNDPGFVERVAECASDQPIADGDWIGAAVAGSGAATTVSVWRWDADPDAGGAPSVPINWGPPDCQMTAAPSVAADDGRGLGIRAYTGLAKTPGRADDWYAGELAVGVCGNGTIEFGEQCDDGGASPTCNADCTFAACGDGIFNPFAEACEVDSDCVISGDVCTASCTCVAPSVCGDGIPEGIEECDTGGASATCDGDCTFPVCGDGELNPLAGETCESDLDCSPGSACMGCSCVVLEGQVFGDEFDGPGLGPDWVVDSGNFSVSGGQLVESSTQKFLNAQMRWAGGLTDTPDQFAKLQVLQRGARTWGLMLRVGSSSGRHYEVHLPSSSWRWELNDPGFVERISECPSDQPIADGDWIGATVTGSGASTTVSVWRWDSDPDAGGAPAPALWGAPNCTMVGAPSVPADDGRELGIRLFTGTGGTAGRADHWAGGDYQPGTCGNGTIEPGEQCDDGGESPTCDADCTVAACGDGIFNPMAEACETDSDCPFVGDVCSASCACVPAPVCGDFVVEGTEQCDTGGASATCDADCTFPVCGDGELNPLAGEQCEDALDCAPGESCVACGCTIIEGQIYGDDFDRPALGPDWTVDTGSFGLDAGQLVESSGVAFRDAQMRWNGGPTDTSDQFAKLQVVTRGSRTWGFMLRVDDSSGHFYQIHLPSNSDWRWELNDPDFVEFIAGCATDQPLADGDWIGAAVFGSGAATTVSVWRWDDDPDAGGEPDVDANWGAPDCAMTGDPSVAADDGRGLGVRAYTGLATAPGRADHWAAGDLDGPPQPPAVVRVHVLGNDAGGAPNTMIDPDGLVVDSLGNVYVASCGLGSVGVGVFRIEPGGAVTQLMDSEGGSALCFVGMAVDSLDNVYVAAFLSDNVYRISPAGVVTEVIDASGDGLGNVLQGALDVAVDGADNLYVTGFYSDNVLKRTPGGVVSEVLDASGGGTGTPLQQPFGIAADAAGSAYVAGFGLASNSVFEIGPGGAVSVILGPAGDGLGNPLDAPHGVAVDAAGNVYVTGNESDNVFRIAPGGAITEILDATGDGQGNGLDNPTSVAVDASGNVYVNGFFSDNAFRIEPSGAVLQIMDGTGDGVKDFFRPADFGIAVDANGDVYTAGTSADNVFRIELNLTP